MKSLHRILQIIKSKNWMSETNLYKYLLNNFNNFWRCQISPQVFERLLFIKNND